jgi:hypothetical protein
VEERWVQKLTLKNMPVVNDTRRQHNLNKWQPCVKGFMMPNVLHVESKSKTVSTELQLNNTPVVRSENKENE